MDNSGIIVPLSFFLVIFGIVYLYFNTRHKERMALIDKGIDAGIFQSSKTQRKYPMWNYLFLHLSLIMIGIGLGILTGSILESTTKLEEGAAYAAPIFLLSGFSLLIGFYLTGKLFNNDKRNQENNLPE